jgi:hypothetical protein
MINLPKAIHRFNEISIKIPNVSFQRNRRSNAKIHMEAQKTLNSQSNPEEKEQCWMYHNS